MTEAPDEHAGGGCLRVLHVVPTYLPATRYGGPIYSVHGLCRALAALGHEVHVFTTNVDGPGDSDVPLRRPVELDGVQVWYFPSRVLRRLYWAPAMIRALRERMAGFDLVHLHSVFLWPTWAAAQAARRAGVPYLIAPRGMLVRDLIQRKSRWLKTAWIELFERRNLERASGIHVTAEAEEEEIKTFDFNLPAVYRVPNGIDPIDESLLEGGESNLVPDQPYVLFLSRINWKKGLDRLVNAWPQVADLLLVIAGNDEEGYSEEIQRLAQKRGVAGRVRCVGPVRGDDKWLLYRNAQLFVLPSYSENFGIVVLEAMAMGCPVLVTPEVGLSNMVAGAGCGRVAEGSPDILAAAINEILADPFECAEMGRRGREMVRKHFLWRSIAQQMETVYRQMKGQRPAVT